MHFWIDKRSQCAYSGRHRVPSSLPAGVGGSRARAYGGYCRKGMAAPVHRFAAVDCPPRRPHRAHRHFSAPSSSGGGGGGARRGDSIYVEVGEAAPTIASLAAARSVTPDTLLRTAALGLHHSPMMAPHLKFGMLVSFALATVFLAGAKYYFDRQVMRDVNGVGLGGGRGAGGGSAGGGGASSGEAGVVCAAVACVCGVGCALSLCRARAPPPRLQPERVSSTAQRPPQLPSEPSDDISLATLLGPERGPAGAGAGAGGVGGLGGAGAGGPGAEAPPPYNIAVLMPAREPSPPPPAYSALS